MECLKNLGGTQGGILGHLTPEATKETSFPPFPAIFYWKDNLLSTYGQRILLDIELGIRKKKQSFSITSSLLHLFNNTVGQTKVRRRH